MVGLLFVVFVAAVVVPKRTSTEQALT